MKFSQRAIEYFLTLTEPHNISRAITLMNPYDNDEVKSIVTSFYNKFYADDNPRLFIFGINPGRFGGGLTGIAFTDPVALRKFCGIENSFGDKRELSSEFIYRVIEAYGGAQKFFAKCFLSAQFPLALLKDGKNYNFYDDRKTYERIFPQILDSVKAQAGFGSRKDKIISLGSKNGQILRQVNEELKIFEKVEVLDHPRYIMQYKRRYLEDYIKKYMEVLNGKNPYQFHN